MEDEGASGGSVEESLAILSIDSHPSSPTAGHLTNNNNPSSSSSNRSTQRQTTSIRNCTSGRVSSRHIVPLLPHSIRIRNVCILAHVDHGKTALSDSLLASNGIISARLAGKLRYMDSREDEQERGITMQSSAISLVIDLKAEKDASSNDKEEGPKLQSTDKLDAHSQSSSTTATTRYLINLIDSPGHVDFAGQVLTATRICDGAIVLVDAVEGVCPQTLSVLRLACRDRLCPVLIINKMDKLITELKMTPSDAADWLHKLVEQVNAFHSTVRAERRNVPLHSDAYPEASSSVLDEYSLQTEEEEEEDEFVFDPTAGNVLFASAIDGWAFKTGDFAVLLARRLGMNRAVLERTLWGQWYFHPSTRRVLSKRQAEAAGVSMAKGTMFAAFILDAIWSVYAAADEDRLRHIAGSLGLASFNGAGQKTGKCATRQVESASRALMTTWLPLAEHVFRLVVDKVLPPSQHRLHVTYRAATESLSPDASSVFVLGEISKMISAADGSLIGMTRLFAGSIGVGERIFVLQPKYTPWMAEEGSWSELTVDGLYILMGRDMEAIERVYAGNVFGLSAVGLSQHVYKAATICSSLRQPSLLAVDHNDDRLLVTPLVRVAVHPADIADWTRLRAGLHALCQADPVAETCLHPESGELILACIGELHLEQCLKDLRERFAKCGLTTSMPMVPFRETIVDVPWTPSEEAQATLVQYFGGDSSRSADSKEHPGSHDESDPDNHGQKDDKRLDAENEILLSEDTIWSRLGKLCVGAKVVFSGTKNDALKLIEEGKNECRLYAATQIDRKLLGSIASGFRMAIEAGPLCAEPVSGVSFVVSTISLSRPELNGGGRQEVVNLGSLITSSKEIFHRAMLRYTPRLLLSTYSCSIQTPATALGRVYSILSRRHASIVSEDYNEYATFFIVHARMAVVESMGFADELRTKTSGIAMPQLVFYGYELLDEDVFSERSECEGDEEDGGDNQAVPDGRAWRYLREIRERKGLFLPRQLVDDAEKQRTLKY